MPSPEWNDMFQEQQLRKWVSPTESSVPDSEQVRNTVVNRQHKLLQYLVNQHFKTCRLEVSLSAINVHNSVMIL
jgi:hypothetical protein